MNDYIKNRIKLETLAISEECEPSELDESYSGALWDWSHEITKPIKDEALKEHIHCETYYALEELFETLFKKGAL